MGADVDSVCGDVGYWLAHATILCGFFFNDAATTEIYTLSLHDALPISLIEHHALVAGALQHRRQRHDADRRDRKSTRLNSSHSQISYAVFCLKKKKTPVSLHESKYEPSDLDLQ